MHLDLVAVARDGDGVYLVLETEVEIALLECAIWRDRELVRVVGRYRF